VSDLTKIISVNFRHPRLSPDGNPLIPVSSRGTPSASNRFPSGVTPSRAAVGIFIYLTPSMSRPSSRGRGHGGTPL
jgi:hypothetical protein